MQDFCVLCSSYAYILIILDSSCCISHAYALANFGRPCLCLRWQVRVLRAGPPCHRACMLYSAAFQVSFSGAARPPCFVRAHDSPWTSGAPRPLRPARAKPKAIRTPPAIPCALPHRTTSSHRPGYMRAAPSLAQPSHAHPLGPLRRRIALGPARDGSERRAGPEGPPPRW